MKSGISFLKLRFSSLGAVAAVLVALSGCSVDMFTHSKPDSEITGREKYRAIRPECSGLKLAHPELDPESFRALVDCFGANGSLPEITALLHDASDRTIRQTVDLLNSTFLADPTVRADSRGIVRNLKRGHRWDAALAGFAPAFENTERLRALIRLLSLGNRDPLIVKTVQGFDSRQTLAGFELLSRIVKSPAFGELSRKVQADPLTVAERDRLLEILTDFFQRSTPRASANLLLRDMTAGKSGPLWNFAFGEGAGIRESVSRFSLLLQDFSGDEGLRKLSLLHGAFRRPVACWGDGKVFPDPWRNLSHEMSVHAAGGQASLLGFVGRFAPLTALAIPDLCGIPDEFLEYYPAAMRLAAGRTGGEYLGILGQVFTHDFGLSAGYFVGEWGVSVSEALTMLAAKPWFNDLLLVFGEFDSDDRELVAGWVRALLRDQATWSSLAKTWTKADLDPVFSDFGKILGYEAKDLSAMLGSIQELFESANLHPWFEGWKRIASESDSNGMQSLADLRTFPKAASAIGRMAEDGRLAAILGDILELLAGAGRSERSTEVVVRETVADKSPRHLLVGSDILPLETRAGIDDSLRACAALDLRKSPAEQADRFAACLAGGGVDARALAGVRIAEGWSIADGTSSRSLVGAWISSIATLPLSTAEKHSLLTILSGDATHSGLSVAEVQASIHSLRELLGTVPALGEAKAVPTEIFSILHRLSDSLSITVSHWGRFYSAFERTIEDVRFAPLGRALRGLVDPATLGDTKIGGASAPSSATSTWIRDLECERDPRRIADRTFEVGREFADGVLGWERPGGKLPLAWSAETLKPRLRAFADAMTPELRAGIYAWLGHTDPGKAAKWFRDRASDPELVAVMDPDTKQLRVRWMTSLDRLESILVNSNFTYLLNGNYGLRFISKFAEAWGDEPRSAWPREIQEKYAGRKLPPRLVDVYQEVETFVRWFEKFGGIPSVPSCVAKDGEVAKVAFDDPWASAPDLLVPFSVKAKAFNLKQTLSVVRENLPGSGTPHADGMRLLRDVFWAVYSSAPVEDRNPSNVERNPLRFFQRLGDLGGLRSISRGLQKLEYASEGAALADAFAGLRAAVSEPAFDRLVGKVLDQPGVLESWVDSATGAPSFSVGDLAFRGLNLLAADRTLRIFPAALRFADSVVGADTNAEIPARLLGDLIVESGTGSVTETRLRSQVASDRSALTALASLGDFLESRVFVALRAFPLREAVTLLDRDAGLRSSLVREVRRWGRSIERQSAVDSRLSSSGGAILDSILAEDRAAARRAIGLWCGTSAARFTNALVSRPDESLLMIDGLLQSGESSTLADFLESLLREVRD